MQKEVKAYFQIIILIFSVFTITSLNSDNAYAVQSCCEKTLDGEYCRFTDSKQCDDEFNSASIRCEQTSYCGVGTCVIDGRCIDSSTKASCVEQKGKFFSQPSSSISECRRGCCLTNDQCSYETELSCKQKQELFTNEEFDFRDIGSEQECLNLCREEQQGCCVDSGSCSIKSESDCGIAQNIITGEGFYSNSLCSSLTQCKSCKPKNNKGCFDDDVYWFDSCGNREGKVEDCNYASGTICSPKTLKCETLDCEDTKNYLGNVHDSRIGGLRKNGESWCVYESGTGDYLDKPGSRHYRVMCVNNEEIVEPCRDFREEICVQSTTKEFTEATCIENNFNSNDEINLDSSKTTVPPGNEFWKGDRIGIGSSFIGNSFGGSTCNTANRQCPVVYVKKNRISSWKCEKNCECEEQTYIDQMAKFCKAQGDCGADFNVLDVYSDSGFRVSGDGKAPKTVGDNEKQNWLRKGVYGGVILLGEEFQKQLEKVELSDIGEKLQLGGTLLGGVGFLASNAFAGAGFYSIGAASGFFPSLEAARASVTALNVGALEAGQQAIALPTAPTIGIGVAFTVAVVAIAVVAFLLSGGKTKIKYVNTTCNSWVAPAGGDNCKKCDDFESCTEYKCKSLGQSCVFIPENEGTNRISCINQNPNDVNSPIIGAWQENITKGYNINLLSYGFELSPTVEPYQRISLGILTNEPSQCKYSKEHSIDFDVMEEFFGDSFYDIKHSITLNSIPGSLNQFYVKCKDANGNENNRDYLIQYSVKPGPDLTPVIIESSNPDNLATIPFNLDTLPFTLYLNEPSECRYSLTDVEYDAMQKTFVCDEQEDVTDNNLFSCLAALNLTIGDNEFFVRCKDSSGNVNSESYLLKLRRSDKLNILSKELSGEIYLNDVLLNIITSGGAENGKAICSFDRGNNSVLFLNTNNNLHTQPLTLDFGDYNYKIICNDKSGNFAYDDIKFSVTKDIKPPQFINIYKEGNELTLTFNEKVSCEYGFTKFSFGSGQLIDQDSETQGFIFEENRIYYLNCKDQFDNLMREIRIIP